jgi:hypothetical protein
LASWANGDGASDEEAREEGRFRRPLGRVADAPFRQAAARINGGEVLSRALACRSHRHAESGRYSSERVATRFDSDPRSAERCAVVSVVRLG